MAGIFLIDGALPTNLIDDPDEIKRQLNTPAGWILCAALGTLQQLIGIGYRFSPDNLAPINIELNARRQQILKAYAQRRSVCT